MFGKRFGRFVLLGMCMLAGVGEAAWTRDAHAADQTLQLPPVLLQLVRNESVWDELKLSPTQQAKLMESIRAVDGRWWLSRHFDAERTAGALSTLTKELDESLRTILDVKQLERLAEIERQACGARMVLRADVADGLAISQEVRARMIAVMQETDRSTAQVNAELNQGSIEAPTAASKLERLKSQEREKIVGTLSDTQKVGIAKLVGQPFDFSTIRRTYPLAPPLTLEGATWIQGGPLGTDELRGKVVAIHFYAFQCINCQRNFPHYQAWQRDYANRGLVVVGIQTPETSAERDIERVRGAAKSDGFDFPVLMDGAGSNWNAWGNTMWPTVYLVDKQGFIRQWWQGEMNWQGTEGEKQMRATIEQLLEERQD